MSMMQPADRERIRRLFASRQAEAQGVKRVPVDIPAWMFPMFTGRLSATPEPVTWTCPVCGVVAPKAWRNGYTRQKCACLKQQQAQEERETRRVVDVQSTRKHSKTYSWLGYGAEEIELQEKTFGNFDPGMQPDRASFKNHLFVVRACTSRIIQGQQQRVSVDNLILAGPCGTGKTHLAAALLNECAQHGVDGRFCTAQDFFNHLYGLPFDKKVSLLEEVASTPIWVCDELSRLHFAHRENGEEGTYQQRTLFDILNKRYKRHLPTIFTANTDDLVPWLDGATISRLYEHMTVLRVQGVDIRLQGRGE